MYLTLPAELIDHIRILGIELELAFNGGSCGGTLLKIFTCEKIAHMSLNCKLLVPV